MSLFWPAGQVFTSVLGWFFITTESICKEDCHPESRFDGWRGVILVVGISTAFMAAIRLLVFRMIESPKFLLKNGERMEAFKSLHALAHYNGNQDTLAGLVIDDIPGICVFGLTC
jgi:MFS family permease